MRIYEHAACGLQLIQSVLLVDCFERSDAGFAFESTSLPGHLLQFVISGKVEQDVGGYNCPLEPGDVIWYHEDELVRGRVAEGPWLFYSINFTAPGLSPPSIENRVTRAGALAREKFDRVLHAWRDQTGNALVREINVHARLLDVLADVLPLFDHQMRISPTTDLWWRLETHIRQNLAEPTSLSDMRRFCGVSNATIIRACVSALGITPMKRVKQIRLNLARGLIRRTEASFSEIAVRVGYGRLHEFSRDYRQWFGLTPTNERAKYKGEE